MSWASFSSSGCVGDSGRLVGRWPSINATHAHEASLSVAQEATLRAHSHAWCVAEQIFLLHIFDIIGVSLLPHILQRNEAEGCAIDAVAHPARGRRAVVEEMSEVGVAVGASHFGAHHAVGGVGELVYGSGGEGRAKAGHPQPESNLSEELKSGSPVVMST